MSADRAFSARAFRAHLQRRGLLRRDFAQECGMSRVRIEQFARGAAYPSARSLKRISETLERIPLLPVDLTRPPRRAA
jgi:transcriptional regulator with XRE-family HTH domain